ncbi:hypothetical protein J6590_000843 [Homalodisca vitripennis]|nr:hypothetical protein J6590_000843 [Homalodisca vitripennis]
MLVAVAATDEPEDANFTNTFDEKLKEMMWKRCAYQLTSSCLKLTLVRLVDRLAHDTYFQPLPGVTVHSNHSRSLEPAVPTMNDLPLQQRLDTFLLQKVGGYLRSLTLSVRMVDLPSFNTTELVDNVLAKVTGRKKGGAGAGAGALAVMMGGAMMTMMMSALAAMAGKALMTSMMALMLAAMGAMKGGGGGGGHSGKSTTYEIIAQPEVSHSHTHSEELHHGHGWKRSVDFLHVAAAS